MDMGCLGRREHLSPSLYFSEFQSVLKGNSFQTQLEPGMVGRARTPEKVCEPECQNTALSLALFQPHLALAFCFPLSSSHSLIQETFTGESAWCQDLFGVQGLHK